MKADKLGQLRKKINALDRKLLKLLHERTRYALAIGKIKKQLKLKIYSPRREQEIINMLVRGTKKPLPRTAVVRIFKTIMSESRKVQRSVR